MANSGAYRLEVTPKARYSGTITVAYTLSNAFGTSAPALATVRVTRRSDPSTDRSIQAIGEAQAEATRRFGRTHLINVMRRAESLHGDCHTSANTLRLASTDAGLADRTPENDHIATRQEQVATTTGVSRDGSSDAPCERAIGLWIAGTVDISTRSPSAERAKIAATTAGVSLGIDAKLADGLTVGVAGSLSHDKSLIPLQEASVTATAKSLSLYASAVPYSGFFVDGALSKGWLYFSTRREDAQSLLIARGLRNGSFTAGALSAGVDQSSGQMRWSLYGRGEYIDADLAAYREYGAGIYDLRFDKRPVRSATGVLGFKLGYALPLGGGSVTSTLRGEWQHEFAGAATQKVDYADVPGEAMYGLASQGWTREQLVMGPQIEVVLLSGWEFTADLGFRYDGRISALSTGVQARKQF